MLFVVVLSLAALATAEPEIQQKVQQVQPNVQEHQQQPIQHEEQQQMAKEVNTVPFYKQIPQASPLSIYGGNMNSRHFPYFGQMMENYPFLPHSYKNLMSYPYRSNYFLGELNKPETSEEQSKVDYGYDDMYHVRAINHHHLVNNVHDIKQKHILRNVDTEIATPYSPKSYDKYPNNYQSKGYSKSLDQEYIQPYNYYNRGYPYANNYYGKNLDQEYIQPYNYYNKGYPYVNKFYGKQLDQEYIQPYNYYNRGYPYVNNYYGKNLDQEYIQPYNYYNRGYPLVNQYYGKSLDQQYIQPHNNYNRYWDLDYIRNYYGRNLNTEFTTPYPWSIEYTRNNNYGRNLNSLNNPWRVFSQLDTPVSSRKINLDTVKPAISTGLETDYIHPITPSSPVVDFITPRISKNIGINNIKHSPKNLDIEYAQPSYNKFNDNITPETLNSEFQPEYISRKLGYNPNTYYLNSYNNLDWETPFNWNDWSLKDVQGRFKRSEPVKEIN